MRSRLLRIRSCSVPGKVEKCLGRRYGPKPSRARALSRAATIPLTQMGPLGAFVQARGRGPVPMFVAGLGAADAVALVTSRRTAVRRVAGARREKRRWPAF